jgi:hypothetical protein
MSFIISAFTQIYKFQVILPKSNLLKSNLLKDSLEVQHINFNQAVRHIAKMVDPPSMVQTPNFKLQISALSCIYTSTPEV